MNNILLFYFNGDYNCKKFILKNYFTGKRNYKGRMTKSNVYYNLTIKYSQDFSLVSIYNIILLNKNNKLL